MDVGINSTLSFIVLLQRLGSTFKKYNYKAPFARNCDIYIPDTKLIRYENNEHSIYLLMRHLHVVGTVDDGNNDMNNF